MKKAEAIIKGGCGHSAEELMFNTVVVMGAMVVSLVILITGVILQ